MRSIRNIVMDWDVEIYVGRVPGNVHRLIESISIA